MGNMHTLLKLFLLTLAVTWLWETAMFLVKSLASRIFYATSLLHPFIVLAIPLWILWPNWIAAMAVAFSVRVIHLLTEKSSGYVEASSVRLAGRRRGGLPELP